MNNLELRRLRYENRYIEFAPSKSIMIVGDRPGPTAPTDSNHNTPFYSNRHCSGWMNKLLDEAQILESKLWWLNSTLRDGTNEDTNLIEDASIVICLGNNAYEWAKKSNNKNLLKIYHPQYHKRFHNKEPYKLIEILKELTC